MRSIRLLRTYPPRVVRTLFATLDAMTLLTDVRPRYQKACHRLKCRSAAQLVLFALAVAVLPYFVVNVSGQDDENEEVKKNYNFRFGPNPFAPGEVRTTTGTFISAAKFISASYCARCHLDAHAQWQQSAHRNSFREPFYKTNVDLFIKEFGIEYSRHCESCHNPVALVSGALSTGSKMARPFDDEGVTCTVCHSIERVTYLEGIGSYELRPPALLLDEHGKPFQGKVDDQMITRRRSFAPCATSRRCRARSRITSGDAHFRPTTNGR